MQQKIRDIMKNPNNQEYIEEMYSSMENELNNKITILKSQISIEEKNNENKTNVVQAKKDALKIFDDILNKEKLDKQDLETIVDCIYIYEDKIIIKLKSNIENILDIGNQLGFSRKNITAVQKNKCHNDRKFFTQVKKGEKCSNVINNGEQHTMLNKFFEKPDETMKQFLIEHPEFLEEALHSDEKTVVRARLCVEGNLYGLED